MPCEAQTRPITLQSDIELRQSRIHATNDFHRLCAGSLTLLSLYCADGLLHEVCQVLRFGNFCDLMPDDFDPQVRRAVVALQFGERRERHLI